MSGDHNMYCSANQPVAWMLTLPDGTHDWILDGNGCEGYIPLYTTPQTKQLSDEEIKEIHSISYSKPYRLFGSEQVISHFDFLKFARAIEAKVRGKK